MTTAAAQELLLERKLVTKYGASVGITQAELDLLHSGQAPTATTKYIEDNYHRLIDAFKNDLIRNDFVDPGVGGQIFDDGLVDILMCSLDANYRYADKQVDAAGSEKQRFWRKIYPNLSRINGVDPNDDAGPPVLTGCLGVEGLTDNLSPQQIHDQCGLDYDASEFNLIQADGTVVRRPTLLEVNVPVTPDIEAASRIPLDPRFFARMQALAARRPPDELSRRAQDTLGKFGDRICPVIRTQNNAWPTDPAERQRAGDELRSILANKSVQDAYNAMQALQNQPRIADFSDPTRFDSMKQPYGGTGIPIHGSGIFATGGHADIRQELRMVKDADGKWPTMPVGSTLSIKLPKRGISRQRAEDPRLPAGCETQVLAQWDGTTWQKSIEPAELATLQQRIEEVYSQSDYQVDRTDESTAQIAKDNPWLRDAKAQLAQIEHLPDSSPPSALKRQIKKQHARLEQTLPLSTSPRGALTKSSAADASQEAIDRKKKRLKRSRARGSLRAAVAAK